MRAAELREMDDTVLLDHIATQRRELFGLRMQHATGSLENTTSIRTAKRDLARALTTARQRGIDPDNVTTD